MKRRALRAAVFRRDGGVCAECGTVADPWVADHVMPLECDGDDDLANLQTLCLEHNRIKTAADATAIAFRHRDAVRGTEYGPRGGRRKKIPNPGRPIQSRPFSQGSRPLGGKRT